MKKAVEQKQGNKKNKTKNVSFSFDEQILCSFNPRERRALRSIKVRTIRDFIDCDLSGVLNLFYVGKTTYQSLQNKQESLRSIRLSKKNMNDFLEKEIVVTEAPLCSIGLNPREIEALHSIGVDTIDDFINCNPEVIGDFPGIGKIKLVKLKKLQEDKKNRKEDENELDLSLMATILKDNVTSFNWTAREMKALNDAKIETVRDFLLYDITLYRIRENVGKKTYLGLQEKQKILLEQCCMYLFYEWEQDDLPLETCPYLTEDEKILFISWGMQSVQEFLFTDLHLFFVESNLKAESSQDRVTKCLEHKKSKKVNVSYLKVPEKQDNKSSANIEIENKIESERGNEAVEENLERLYHLIQRQKEIRVLIDPQNRFTENKIYSLWEKTILYQTLRGLPFYTNRYNHGFNPKRFHDSFCSGTSLGSLTFSKPLQLIFQRRGLITLGQLLLTPSIFFEQMESCSPQDILEMQNVIDDYLLENKNKTFEPDLYSSETFACSLIRFITWSLKKKDHLGQLHIDEQRRSRILIERAGGRTLDDIGHEFDITRERVRQIERSIWRQIEAIHKHLEPLELILSELLNELGGFTCRTTLYQAFADKYHWSVLNARYFLERLMEIMRERFTFVDHDYIRFNQYQCGTCEAFMKALELYIQEVQERCEVLSVDKISAHFKQKKNLNLCASCSCGERHKEITVDFLSWVFETNSRFKGYRKSKVVRMSDRLGLYESILMSLRMARRPLTKKEILAEVQKLNPQMDITEKQIKTTAGNSLQHTREILLWNRGGMNTESMYVYKEYVTTTAPILSIIEEELLESHRKNNIPQMRLNRIFVTHRDECIQQGIPNVYALFACLKCRGNSQMTFQRSPYIGFAGQYQKISNARIFEDYVRSAGGVVSAENLKDYGRSLGLRDEHIQNTISLTHLVAANAGFALCENFDVDGIEFRNLLANIDEVLSLSEHLTITEIFIKNEELCKKLKISDPRMLYHILKKYANERYVMVFPVIALRHENTGQKLRKLVSARIVDWIKEQGGPLCLHQLLEHFTKELGFPQSTIYRAINGANVYACGNGMYVHASYLDWTPKKKKQLFKLLQAYWQEQCAKGIPYGSVIELVEKYRRKFPPLANRFPWNRGLLLSMLSRYKEITLWGNCRNIFGFVNSDDSVIRSFGDLLKFLLKKQYGNKAPLKEFAWYLAHDIKMIKRELTPFMIQDYPDLKIMDGEIVILE